MEDTETFTLVPLYMDPASKTISSSNTSRSLQEELAALNDLHKAFKKLDTDVPPPPIPVNPKRSAGITKLRESGNAEFRAGKHTDAINYYTLGLQMALTRPAWEPSGLVRDEVAGLYSNRAMAHVAISNWVEGSVDAEASVEAKKAGNAKAWWRKGRCLIEMGRLEEAKEWVGKGLEMEGNEADLVTLLKEIEGKNKKS
ncbi:Translocation protein [Lachnellula occidentalis]|uniref:Translocation protein n=1 Tax=Lachnellula occidentalis TaxID=215460 RepID=A0A8H8S4K9_9HELO|nr:Translocation protein [Lachnellula occidentalis]